MNLIIQKLMKVLGWQKLLKMVWEAVQDDLKKAALKTETKIDDKGLELADFIIDIIVNDKAAELAPTAKKAQFDAAHTIPWEASRKVFGPGHSATASFLCLAKNQRPQMTFKRSFGLAECIQSGILLTLLGIAFGVGQVMQKIESKIDEHEKRITMVESYLR